MLSCRNTITPLSFYVLLARRGGGLTSEVFFPMWPPSLHSSLVCPPQPPPSSHPSCPTCELSAPYAASVHCSIELFYYEIPFGMEAWWLLILSGDLKLHHFNINLSSHLRTFFSSFIISLIVSRCTRVYHNDVVVVDLWTTLNSSMYQNSFIAQIFSNSWR